MKDRKGFTLVEIMIVVAIIGIIIAIAIPGFLRAREVSRGRACQENLHKIEGAKEQYALEGNVPSSATPTWGSLIGETLYIKRTPICPGGGLAGSNGIYTIKNLESTPTCGYVPPTWATGPNFQHSI